MLDPMLDGILYERLGQHGRYLQVLGVKVFIYFDAVIELFGEADLLQGEVIFDEIDLFIEGNELFIGAIKYSTHQVGKAREVNAGIIRVFGHDEILDAGQGVIEKVRVHLGTKQPLLQNDLVLFGLQPVLPESIAAP